MRKLNPRFSRKPKLGRAKARLRKAYVAASPMVCPTLCQGAPKRSDGDLIPSERERLEPSMFHLNALFAKSSLRRARIRLKPGANRHRDRVHLYRAEATFASFGAP